MLTFDETLIFSILLLNGASGVADEFNLILLAAR